MWSGSEACSRTRPARPSCCDGAPAVKPGPILVVVPTTGGPLVLRALKSRPGLPMSAAFAAGDYRPLPWSGDYARLSAEGGPLSRLPGPATGPGLGPGPYELRLSGSFDAGRSWEAPVCLAHALLAQGYVLTPDPGEARIVIWATGAVDLDLAILPGAYALLDKIERSRALLAEVAGAELVALLPDGSESAEAARVLRGLGRARPPLILPSESVIAALDAFGRPTPAAPARRRPSQRFLAAGLAGLSALTAVGLALSGLAVPRWAPTVTGAGPEPAKPAEASRPGILVEELVAPAGSSCRRVAFGADPPERRAIPAEANGRLRPSRLTPDLCGLAFRLVYAGASLAVSPALAAATLPPTRLPDGAQAYLLREGARRNLVYTVQAMPEAGAAEASNPLEHALVR